MQDHSTARFETLHVGNKSYEYCPVSEIKGAEKLPYSLIVLLENILRNVKGENRQKQAAELVDAALAGQAGGEIEFMPARVLLTDFTGVPCMVDFAAMREAIEKVGGKASQVNPLIPADLVIDHSVIADVAGCAQAADKNAAIEFDRNKERYTFLKWAQGSFENVRIVPPDMGICHQLNLERLSYGVFSKVEGDKTVVYPDSLIGADSHTTTVNGIAVTGWGVGGIEAEAAMLGQPVTILIPQAIGIKLTGKLQDGVGAMDLALTIANRLRSIGVVGKFVECFGEGVASLSANDRATVANMSPEYGCTITLFPFDNETVRYYRTTGRSKEQVALIEAYAKAQHLWHTPEDERVYSHVIEINLSDITPVIAGPSRPHDKIEIAEAKTKVEEICASRGLDFDKTAAVTIGEQTHELTHGAIAIAAITSCTTTANPDLIVTAGLLAKNAVEAGLTTKPWIKRMWSPGSGASELIMERTGLSAYLDQLGFYTAGFGCMSCIGNSGPLTEDMQRVGKEIELTAVLSGNRNFEGRIGPDISQNYLAAPANVIAYALAGTVDFDFEAQPLGRNADGPVYLRDIYPTREEVKALVDKEVTAELFDEAGKGLYEGTEAWQALNPAQSETFEWEPESTYIRRPPYFESFSLQAPKPQAIEGARVIVKAGDFITTDHISPAGSIALETPAAAYLEEHGVDPKDFNTYGARRGNHEVMMRGTFANIKMKNQLAEGKVGGYTKNFLTNEVTTIWDASRDYAEKNIPLVVLAGKMYGSGSSRDWAAKGPMLIGVKAAFAESFERIHRSNLIGMGVLPLQYKDGENAETLGLTGTETFTIPAIDLTQGEFPRTVSVTAADKDGNEKTFEVIVRVDTPTEGLYLANGGIPDYMLRELA